MSEVGFVRSVKNFLVHLDGMPTARINTMVENEDGVRGWVSALLSDQIEVLLVDAGDITPGTLFKRTEKQLSVPVGPFLLGRAISPLGVPIDGKGVFTRQKEVQYMPLDQTAQGIRSREFINRQIDTGVTIIDSLIPIGRGQRELVVGDARSGKTDFLTDVIINQSQTGMLCIYAAIGKPVAELGGIIETLQANNAFSHVVVVAASSSDPSPLIFLTPYTAITVAEYFQRQGRDVLVILDDMGNHAKIYREISLLGNRSAGRESYPGDMFYQQAHLLERAGNFNKAAGGGSITALPVIELNLSDFTTLIPTNMMSMTDGHLLFKSTLYNQGSRPAIDLSLSVSRVGQQTQHRVQNMLASKIKQILTQASQLESVSRFSFELPFTTQLILRQKELIGEMLKQPPLTYIPKEIQVILLTLPLTRFLQDKERSFVIKHKKTIIEAFTLDPVLVKITQSALNYKNDLDLFNALEAVSDRLQQIIIQKGEGNAHN